MEDRDFTEIDLRKMLEAPRGLRGATTAGRWIVETVHDGDPWEVVVETDSEEKLLVVVTAYPCDR